MGNQVTSLTAVKQEGMTTFLLLLLHRVPCDGYAATKFCGRCNNLSKNISVL